MKYSNRDVSPPSPPPFNPYVVELTVESADEEKALNCIFNNHTIIRTLEELYYVRDFAPWEALRNRASDMSLFVQRLRTNLR